MFEMHPYLNAFKGKRPNIYASIHHGSKNLGFLSSLFIGHYIYIYIYICFY